jgi:phosphoglycerate-specific signal transduction histidine kinase
VSLAEKVIEEFEGNVRLRRRLAELLVVEPDVRLTIINAVSAEVATKRDINEIRAEISKLRNEIKAEISELRREIYSNFRWTIGVIITVWGAAVIPILLRLIGAI